MKYKTMDIARLRGLLHYDPDTGILTWRVRPSPTVAAGAIAGKIADGYVVISVDDSHWQAHRLAWAITHGEWPNGEIDHINRKRTDNRLSNLRVLSRYGQALNCDRIGNRPPGTLGTVKNKRGRGWYARIQRDGKLYQLGKFDRRADAHAAYIAARDRLYAPQAPAGNGGEK